MQCKDTCLKGYTVAAHFFLIPPLIYFYKVDLLWNSFSNSMLVTKFLNSTFTHSNTSEIGKYFMPFSFSLSQG